jgi:hypothetical protein
MQIKTVKADKANRRIFLIIRCERAKKTLTTSRPDQMNAETQYCTVPPTYANSTSVYMEPLLTATSVPVKLYQMKCNENSQ